MKNLRISAALKGNKHRLGKKHSEESKLKISQSLKGNKNRLGKKKVKQGE